MSINFNFSFYFLAYCMLILSCDRTKKYQSQGIDKAYIDTDTNNYANILFDDEEMNFGKIKEGEKVKVIYKFMNSGPSPLIIYDVKLGCGCTSADWRKTPLEVKMRDSLTVIFDSTHKQGKQMKSIVVFYNGYKSKFKVLTLTGIINKI